MSARALARALWAETRALAGYARRPRTLVLWLVPALVWPFAAVAFLGQGGATPLHIAFALAANPIGPLLYATVGASLASVRGRELSRAWPAPAPVRAGGAAIVLIGLGLIGALCTLACTLWHVSGAFWVPFSYARISLASGFGLLFATIVFWLAIGFALGMRTRGPWRTVLALLAPAVFLVTGTVIGSGPVTPPYGFIALSPAAWFTSRVDAFGLGPWGRIYTWVLLGTSILALWALVVAALCAYGRHLGEILLAGALTVAVLLTGLGVGAQAASLTPNDPFAARYLAGAKSPVTVTRETVSVSVLGAPDLVAVDRLRFLPQRPLSVLRIFLPPALAIRSVSLFERGTDPVTVRRQGKTGWVRITTKVPLPALRTATLRIAYAGNPLFLPGTEHANLTTFVSAQGFMLPVGTWYPLLGPAVSGTRWAWSIAAPSGDRILTDFGPLTAGTSGHVSGSGTGAGLTIVGGHLAPVGRVAGVLVEAAADQTALARAALQDPGLPHPLVALPTERACLTRLLRPEVHASVIWATIGTPGVAPIETVLAPDDLPWQGRVSEGEGENGGIPGLAPIGPSFDYQAEVFSNFPTTVVSLWLSGGQSSAIPQSGALANLGAGLAMACGGFPGNGVEVEPIQTTIGNLPLAALERLTRAAYPFLQRGTLTEGRLRELVGAVSVPSPGVGKGAKAHASHT